MKAPARLQHGKCDLVRAPMIPVLSAEKEKMLFTSWHISELQANFYLMAERTFHWRLCGSSVRQSLS